MGDFREKNAIIEKINTSFDNDTKPEISLCQACLVSNSLTKPTSDEGWEAASKVGYALHWKDLHEEVIEKYAKGLFQLHGADLVFYIPAFMVLTMRYIDDSVWSSDIPDVILLLLTIDRRGNQEYQQAMESRFEQFSVGQSAAIYDFLNYIKCHSEIYKREAEAAIISYWQKRTWTDELFQEEGVPGGESSG